MKQYYNDNANNQSIAPFAFQLYSIAEHWFLQSDEKGSFIDDAFSNAANDVGSNPRYSSFTNSPLLFPNTTNLAVLGKQHLTDHIKPAFQKQLRDGIDSAMRSGLPFKQAYVQTAHELTAEHELFLTQSVPYGIQQLKSKDMLGWLPVPGGHVGTIQGNARGMRYTATLEVLQDYARRNIASSADIYVLVHETDSH